MLENVCRYVERLSKKELRAYLTRVGFLKVSPLHHCGYETALRVFDLKVLESCCLRLGFILFSIIANGYSDISSHSLFRYHQLSLQLRPSTSFNLNFGFFSPLFPIVGALSKFLCWCIFSVHDSLSNSTSDKSIMLFSGDACNWAFNCALYFLSVISYLPLFSTSRNEDYKNNDSSQIASLVLSLFTFSPVRN